MKTNSNSSIKKRNADVVRPQARPSKSTQPAGRNPPTQYIQPARSVQAGPRRGHVAAEGRNDHCCGHEDNRLAKALCARVLGRRGAKKLELTLVSEASNGERVYRIADGKRSKAGSAKRKRAA